MKLLKKICVLVLIISTLNLTFFGNAFANDANKKNSITKMPVEIRSTPAEQIPEGDAGDKQNWFDKYKWWILSGLVIAAGGAAAAGGGDDDGGPNTPGGQEGSYTVSW